jgi:pilus assembly protein CpaF
VRGGEICDVLLALNTGHEGGCATVHANSATDVPTRLEALAALGGLPREAAHAQVAAGLRVVIHVARAQSGHRRVAEIHLLRRLESGFVATTPAWTVPDQGPECPGEAATELDRLIGGGS